ncbi:fimbrial protein [Xenorhabdus sp. SF857]|uniref:fimbrial protein n=1 Tax=Xenorhabdus bakwenae TaxID=3026967 RepID=UPI0025582B47|nr:fimbrial protein [Xenorhabdus sp. SF857]WFQ80810.1 fimbrial protein [Xenorhabdus sp. SF857]
MKNVLVSSFIVAILALVSNISYAAPPATTGEVKFTGRIIETTCTVSNDTDKIVNMGTYLKSDIKTAGSKVAGSERDFKIKLTGCPIDASAPIMMDVTFSGSNADAEDPKLLALDALSSSKGIGIGIYDENDNQISLSSTYSFPDTISKSDMVIPLKAAYVSNGAPSKAGTAEATLHFNINYR